MKRFVLVCLLLVVFCFVACGQDRGNPARDFVNTYSQKPIKPIRDDFGIRAGLTDIERMIIEENDVEKLETLYNDVLLNDIEQCATIFELRFQRLVNMEINREHYSSPYNLEKVVLLLYPIYLFYTQLFNSPPLVGMVEKMDDHDATYLLMNVWFNLGRSSMRSTRDQMRRIDGSRNTNNLTDTEYITLMQILNNYYADDSWILNPFSPRNLERFSSQFN